MIIAGARAFDLDLQRHHTELFALHARELLHWNRAINLTAITDPFEIAIKHFVDSLAPARMISPGANLLDIGSGGGFPGIVLKVIQPSGPPTWPPTLPKTSILISLPAGP